MIGLLQKLRRFHADGSSIPRFKTTEEEALAQKFNEEIESIESIAGELEKNIEDLTKEGGLTNKQHKEIYRMLLSEESYIANPSNSKSANIKDLTDKINNSRDPLEIKNLTSELITASKKQIVDKALEVVCRNLSCQSAAIFLFSKSGRLQRFGIRGWDKSGLEVDRDWFADESYEVDDSFTGRAAQPKAGGYGEIQFTEILEGEDLNPTSRREYQTKFGKLKCAIAIPLNGRNRTYGVLRVINKVEKSERDQREVRMLSNELFSNDDVKLLLSLSTYVSTALSNFRRDIQSEILKYLSRLLIHYPYGGQRHNAANPLKDVCQQVVDLLVQNPETAFQACILRTKGENGSLEFQASSLFSGITDTRDDCPKVPEDSGAAWVVVGKGKRLIIQDIQDSPLLDQFNNKKWIEENKFMSFGCFPLVEKDEVVGTLSVYIGYKYKFYPDGIGFLQGIADLLALFFLKVKQEQQERELQNSIYYAYKPLDQHRIDSKIALRFKELAREWKNETATLPILLDRFTHPAYQKIIGLGYTVVPLIIAELIDNPDHWFWALEAIVGESPVLPEQSGKIQEMITAWVDWGRRQGYVLNT